MNSGPTFQPRGVKRSHVSIKGGKNGVFNYKYFVWGSPWRYNKPFKRALHPFLLCERLILHRGGAIKEWTLLFWTISARYLLNNPNNYENRGGCYRPYYGVRSPLKFMVWFSTSALEFYSWIQNFSLFLIYGKRFYTFLWNFELNFFIWPCSVYIFNSRCQITQLNHAIFNSTNKFLFTATIFSVATL